MNTLGLAQRHVLLRKASSTKGGEWHGPCPWCGGKDRFHVWPEQDGGRGTYWCRSCGKGGDAIQFLRDCDGMTFKEACDYLNIRIDEKQTGKPDATPHEYQPREPQTPVELWQEKAEKFITWAQERLKENRDAIDWLAARGISAEAAAKYRLGWNPGEDGKDIYRARKTWGLPDILKENGRPKALWLPVGLVIPYCPPLAGVQSGGGVSRIRIRRPEGEPRYYVLPGSSSRTMLLEESRKAFVVVESELDAIACASACGLTGAIATGSLESKPDAAAYAVLKNAKQILNALDFGDQGGGKEAARRAMKWWKEQFGDQCDRWPVPKGKDPGEAYASGIDLGAWIKGGLWPVLRLEETKGSPSTAPARKNAATAKPGGPSEADMADIAAERGLSPLVVELWQLLRKNPAVKIINRKEGGFSLLRNGKPGVGGRIHELITREPVVFDFILEHEDEEINGRNLIKP